MTHKPFAVLLLILLLAGGRLGAQQTTGLVAGQVTDPQAAAVADAIVTATNPATGFTRMATTDRTGSYRLISLPVGTYDLSVTRQGFSTALRRGIEVNVADTRTVDVDLELAGVAEAVTVVAPVRLTDPSSSSVGQVVDLVRVRSLPLNGRQFANLAATVPGVGLGFHLDPTKGLNFAPQVNGGAGRNVNYLIDGGDNNDDTVGGLLQQFPLEGIQEFNLQTAGFKAEYGRTNGGVMNVVTKSGSNRYQGSLFELFRDKGLNALTENEKLAAAPGTTPAKGDYSRNQFGGSFGGPIVQNRAFFFAAIERTQQDTTQPVSTKGLFPSLDGSAPIRYRENLDTAKLTFTVNPDQYVAVRYGWNNNTFPFGAGPLATPDNWGDTTNHFSSLNLNHNWVLSGSTLNEFIFQYASYDDHIDARTAAPNFIFPNGVTTGSNLGTPQSTLQTKYQLRDDFSWHVDGHGGMGHTFKAGASFINEPRLQISATTGKGIASYTMATNSLTGPVARVTMADGGATANIPNKQYGLYVQDDWRLTPRLTINAGLRYDLATGFDFDQSKNPNFVRIQNAAKAGLLTGIVGLENFGLDEQSDRNNFQPRIGAALDVRGNGKDVIRGGWGIYTDLGYTNSNVLLAALDASSTHFGNVLDTGSSRPAGLTNPDGSLYRPGQPLSNIAGFNTVTPGAVPLQGQWADPRLQQPYQIQTNVGWSHELTASTIVTVDYVNALGRDLNYKPRLNQIDQATGLRRISELLPVAGGVLSPNNSSDRPALSRGLSQYNALTLALNRRLSRGLDVSASYTLARALSNIGNSSDELNTANIQNANNPFDAPVQMGPDVFTDARHRVTISAIVQMPYGIQVAPFFTYRSALPLFLIDGRDLNKDGEVNDIPGEAFAVDGTDAATGKTTVKDIGTCTTVNCGRGWPQSQLNLRVSKLFHLRGGANVEAIAEVFNLFNAINPLASSTTARSVFTSAGAANPGLLQPSSYSGDATRPEQRVGQIGFRLSF